MNYSLERNGHGGPDGWRNVTPGNPCPICKKSSWCSVSADGDICNCRRLGAGAAEEKQDASGSTYYVHRLRPRPPRADSWPEPIYSLASGKGVRAEPNVLYQVYKALLSELRLSSQHAKALEGRGLDPKKLLQIGYRTHGKGRGTAAQALIRQGMEKFFPHVPGFFDQERNDKKYWTVGGSSGLLIPVRDEEKRIVALLVRPDASEGGKYLWLTSKSKNRGGPGPGAPIHVPLFDGDTSVIRVTEGALKSDCATHLSGILTIGLPGVGSWQRAAPVLKKLDAKTVRVAYDADCRTNLAVAGHLQRLVQDLRDKGFAVELETWDAADGKGIDDLLKTGKTPKVLAGEAIDAALADIVAAAQKVNPPSGAKVKEKANDPHKLARCWLFCCATRRDRQLPPDSERIGNAAAFFQDAFWLWDGTRWVVQRDGDMKATLTVFVKARLDEQAALTEAEVPRVTPSLILAVLGAVAGDCLIPAATPFPSWRGPDGAKERNWIAVANGILDVDGLLAGVADPLRPHSPSWFSPVCLPYPFDPKADCPKWEAFLARNLGDDSAKARLLQQWAGYLLTNDTSYHRFLLMSGEGANGKSVACAAVRGMLGEDNVSTVGLEFFGDKFRLASTVGKQANISAEVGEIDKVAEGLLKAFVSGDPLEFERKFKQPFTARPTARLMLATNTLPQFSDKTDGIWRRVLLVPFTIQIPEKEQVRGMDKPDWWHEQGELPGILNWALAGLHDLRQQGRFLDPPSCSEAKEKLRIDSSPARRFLQEECAFEPDRSTPKDDVYAQYRGWARAHGHCPLAENKFAAEVVRVHKGVVPAKAKPEGQDKRFPVYRGLVLNDRFKVYASTDR